MPQVFAGQASFTLVDAISSKYSSLSQDDSVVDVEYPQNIQEYVQVVAQPPELVMFAQNVHTLALMDTMKKEVLGATIN